MDLNATLNVAEAAELYGLHRHTVEGWVKDGLPADRTNDGRVLVHLREMVQWVRRREADRAAAALEKARGDHDEDSSKARKLKAEARLKELTVAERERRLVAADEVEQAWLQMLTAIRESVMNVAAALVQSNLIEPGDEVKVDEVLRDALEHAALPERSE